MPRGGVAEAASAGGKGAASAIDEVLSEVLPVGVGGPFAGGAGGVVKGMAAYVRSLFDRCLLLLGDGKLDIAQLRVSGKRSAVYPGARPN